FLPSFPTASPPSFPTRRSSDLFADWRSHHGRHSQPAWHCRRTGWNILGLYSAMEHISGADCRVLYLSNVGVRGDEPRTVRFAGGDRKSTRLNSSHVKISYAVFC